MRNGQIKAAVIAGILAVGLLGSMAQVKVTRGWNLVSGLLQFGGSTSASPALKPNGATLQARLADDSGFTSISASGFVMSAGGIVAINASTLIHSTTPTISSGFGTSPSIVNSNGTAAFTVNVGTGGVATSGVIGLPTATNGWSCSVNDRTNNNVTRQTATTTTTATFTAAAAWAASDILNLSCFGY